jgi:hypothetical protein
VDADRDRTFGEQCRDDVTGGEDGDHPTGADSALESGRNDSEDHCCDKVVDKTVDPQCTADEGPDRMPEQVVDVRTGALQDRSL